MHEEARDPALALPCELALARPVAAQPDLHIALGIDDAGLDEPVHRGAVRALDAEDLGAGVRVRVEMHEPDGTVRGRAGADVRLRDGVVRLQRVGRDDRRVAEVHDLQHLRGVDAGLEVRPRRTARRPDRSRTEARARAV